MSTHEPTDLKLGKPLKVEAQSVDTTLTTQEAAVLDGTPSPVEPTAVHERALQQLGQLRTHLEAQRQHLETTGGILRKLFERVRGLWSKQEQSATAVVRLGIEMDHLEDQVRQASPQQIEQHLGKKLTQLQQQIEQIQLVSVEVDRFTETAKETAVEDEAQFPIESAGGMKNWSGTLAEQGGKLGKYGQDCIRSNGELGISVVADGISDGIESFEVARRASRRAQAILEDIPFELCDSIEEVQFFVQGELNGILNDVNAMASKETGGTTLLATRYIEKFDAVVMIDLGDCEACAVAGTDVLSIKTVSESIKTPPHIIKTPGAEEVPQFINPTGEPIVKIASLGKFRQAHTGEPIQILLTTDGLKNTTGQNLEQLAVDIVAKGPKKFIHDIGSEIIFRVGDEETGSGKVSDVHPFADDTTIISMTIPAEIQPAAQVKAKAVAA